MERRSAANAAGVNWGKLNGGPKGICWHRAQRSVCCDEILLRGSDPDA